MELLFRLANVPEDEACDVRQLLDDNHIDYYETDAGRWRLGVDALWLKDKSQLQQARDLISQYQQQRYQQAQQQAVQQSWWQVLKAHPLQLLMTVLSVVIVLGVSILPFLHL